MRGQLWERNKGSVFQDGAMEGPFYEVEINEKRYFENSFKKCMIVWEILAW